MTVWNIVGGVVAGCFLWIVVRSAVEWLLGNVSKMAQDWLTDFVDHTSYGETPAKIMFWVGVVTIAGALQRKVWIDQYTFQWTPNFYLLIVTSPGKIKKSTSIGLGTRLLKRIEDIDFGPQYTTWQSLITHMAGQSKRTWDIKGEPFEASCCTIALSEFGTFFDPNDRMMVDALTDLWDAKLETVKKETKTNGCDDIVNPWINIYACTTPRWIANNFGPALVGTGFACRPVYLYCDKKKKRVALPKRHMPEYREMRYREEDLVARLRDISSYAGEYRLTKEAEDWIEIWYEKYCDFQETLANSLEADLYERGQTHLMKLAMVISASRGNFPVIDVSELQEADQKLSELTNDVSKIFDFVGQSPTSKYAKDIIEALTKHGGMTRRDLYKNYFFRTIGIADFDDALKSVNASGLITEAGSPTNPFLSLK